MKIYKYPDPVLSTKCEPVTIFDEALKFELEEMTKLMIEFRGIGLSANQVGLIKRMFLLMDVETKDIHEFINPVITHFIDEHILISEGCLSAPGVFLEIPRLKYVVIKAQDYKGEEFSVELNGIEAVCAQHEMEHLDGVFFLDKGNRQDRRRAAKILKLKR